MLSHAVKWKWAQISNSSQSRTPNLLRSSLPLLHQLFQSFLGETNHTFHTTLTMTLYQSISDEKVCSQCCVNLRNGKIFCKVTASPGSVGHLLCAIRRRSSRRTWRSHIQLIQVHSLQRGSKFPKIFESTEEASVSMKKESQSSHITSETPCATKWHTKD